MCAYCIICTFAACSNEVFFVRWLKSAKSRSTTCAVVFESLAKGAMGGPGAALHREDREFCGGVPGRSMPWPNDLRLYLIVDLHTHIDTH